MEQETETSSQIDHPGRELIFLPTLRERRLQAAKRLAEARRLYTGSGGQQVLRRSFAVYLDGLGTKAAIATLDDKMLNYQITLLDRFRWLLHDEGWQEGYQRFLSFTDNVVVGVPVEEDTSGAEELSNLLDSVERYQVSLAGRGQFMRGGVAVGNLYIDDRLATGPALVDAAILEEEIAIYPRVVLSDACVELIVEDLATCVKQQMPSWDDLLLVDADGVVFLNYLTSISQDDLFFYEEDEEEDSMDELEAGLMAHRYAVEEKLRKFAAPSRIREKYRWVADYHDYVCAEFLADSFDYLIDNALLTPLERQYPRQFRRFASSQQ